MYGYRISTARRAHSASDSLFGSAGYASPLSLCFAASYHDVPRPENEPCSTTLRSQLQGARPEEVRSRSESAPDTRDSKSSRGSGVPSKDCRHSVDPIGGLAAPWFATPVDGCSSRPGMEFGQPRKCGRSQALGRLLRPRERVASHEGPWCTQSKRRPRRAGRVACTTRGHRAFVHGSLQAQIPQTKTGGLMPEVSSDVEAHPTRYDTPRRNMQSST